ncbi:MAG TPA: hypothetical protein PKV73_15795 [Agriterribacter sp.]|nr:hypothetical protein [Agriterribacter sp.]
MNDTQQQFFTVPGWLYDTTAAIRKAGSYSNFTAAIIASLDPEIVRKISFDLELSFIPLKEKESEVCFINSEEVRPEFKLSFAPVDLSDYILAVLHQPGFDTQKSSSETHLLQIPYPTDVVGFWALVTEGEKLRHDTDSTTSR